MDSERYTTRTVGNFKMVHFALAMVSVLVAEEMAESAGSRGMVLLIWAAALLLCFGLMCLVDLLFAGGEIVLTSKGVEKKTLVKTVVTPWHDLIQAGTVKYDGASLVVLVKRGGHKLPENGNWEWFRIRNFGRLLYLPDEEQARRFVTAYYGSLDFDLGNKKKGIADL